MEDACSLSISYSSFHGFSMLKNLGMMLTVRYIKVSNFFLRLYSYPVEDTNIPHEQIVSPMERRMSSIEEHNEELNSDLDDDDSSAKTTQRPPKGTKPSSLKLCSSSGDSKTAFLSSLQFLFVCFLLIIQFYCLFVHSLFGFLSRLEFLPLLLTSVSCAVGVVWSWLVFYHQVVFS